MTFKVRIHLPSGIIHVRTSKPPKKTDSGFDLGTLLDGGDQIAFLEPDAIIALTYREEEN